MSENSILRLANVTKQYANAKGAAVAEVSLTLEPGEIMALLGPSGCGKTTLLRLMAGFERPDGGTIELAGTTVASAGEWVPPERRRLGMVFQEYALFPHLKVADNVGFGLQRVSKKEAKQRIEEMLSLVGLQGMENRYPHELSGGQRQRVALARALAPAPTLVLLDEPLSNLDLQVRLYLREEIRKILKNTGTTAIFVTHDQEEALAISDRVGVMRHGKIEQLGTPEEIYSEPASRFVAGFVTRANFLPAKRLGQVWETEVGCFHVGTVGTGEPGDRLPVSPSPRSVSEAEPRLPVSPSPRLPIGERSRTAVSPSPRLPVSASPRPPISESPWGEVMIREEDLCVIPDEGAATVIGDRQFLGREHRYCLITPSGQEIHARTQNSPPLPIGTRVQIAVSPDISGTGAVRVYPPDED
ncbi:MAG TPA: ABC transporter ATP-binding protein [Oscillatoriaceae cyanobacterium M33_DOE_052]|uniref:ABC-type quaternary amine transporter n=1 Tax=Planktothricoides sp. SpSt-374 TaxID=2282167 RepID=A0A7C3VGM4_9CYAN|nr:ABC transporter ATP-binding protein [Oscillatoriaceae cyanobacterium M33_DOE_052]